MSDYKGLHEYFSMAANLLEPTVETAGYGASASVEHSGVRLEVTNAGIGIERRVSAVDPAMADFAEKFDKTLS